MNSIYFQTLTLIIAYLLGSIPSGFLAGKWLAGIDIRKHGSGSTGATNVLRQVGKGAALTVFLIDVGKGTCAVLLAKLLELDETWQILLGVTALSGHIWPIWLKGQGGKAVATALGMLLGISWQVGLASLGIFLSVLWLSKIVSLSSITAAICLPLLMHLEFNENTYHLNYLLLATSAMTLVLWRHRENVKRLLNGKEPRIGKKI